MPNENLSYNDVFTPGAPIDKRELFAGRLVQIRRVVETIPSPGRHPLIFGERGVGKTSLANILSEVLPDIWTVKVNCDSLDTFTTLWNRILQKASFTFKQQAFGFSKEEVETHLSLKDYVTHDGDVLASEVADIFKDAKTQMVFIIDEFDRIVDKSTKLMMSDVIKNLSDNIRGATIVIVGVGSSISDLIGEHPSIQRNLVQIEIPKMKDEELEEIVVKGCTRLGLNADKAVLTETANLANGFPHYAHLLGLSIAKACTIRGVKHIDMRLFREFACSLAIEDAIETYRNAFSKATRTSKPSRYTQILCACGHARHDEQNVFRATDVVDAMKAIFSEDLTIQAVVPALGQFCSNERGPILEKVPVGDRSHYQFVDQMMRPFLRIKAKVVQMSNI